MANSGGSRMGVILAAASMVGAAALPGWAQEEEAQGAFGGGPQVLIVQAEQFQGRQNLASGDLAWSAEFYYSSSASATPVRYFAPLQLPAGAVITNLQCFVRDSSAANNITFFLWEDTHDVVTNTPLGSTFASMASVGATGYQQPTTAVTPPRTVRYANGNLRNVYHVSADLATDTFLRECRITWRRSVSPAPATATFTDVPVGHPQRTFVEALVAAGITGGCGAGTYCPDAAVTRGQMAVFLSVALGLHWPQ
jgi:S-layer family protein